VPRKPAPSVKALHDEGIWHQGMVDSHFHSSALRSHGIDPAMLLRDLAMYGMDSLVDVAIEPEDTTLNATLSRSFPGLYRTCGLHPSSSGREDWRQAIDSVVQRIDTGAFAAVGEMGLDWYRQFSPRERQQEVFEAQLAIARSASLPVIVHNREADDDCLQLIRSARLPRGGIMHCYSSDTDRVSSFLDAGMHISFAGNITFPAAHGLRDALARVPMDRLLLETDSPFISPHPYRGRVNHPGMITCTYAVAAEVRRCTVQDLAQGLAGNLRRLLSTPRAAAP
jgi:TatD DNase family protein